MAGRGSRFAQAGYIDPKPLIEFGGRPMIQWVVDNLRPSRPHRFIFLCLAEHLERYPALRPRLEGLCPGCVIIPVAAVTQGAACTVLLAREWIDTSAPLMIANSDQFVELAVDDYLGVLDETRADGLIMTFRSDHPKWSYCRLRPDGSVSEVVEKQVVSNEATVGIYNFAHGADYAAAADAMMASDLRVNGEFYVAPTYNVMIARGARILPSLIRQDGTGMHGLGTPEDLDLFLRTEAFRRLAPGQSRSLVP
jgi:dTDP-glucose pyrophosphorylase